MIFSHAQSTLLFALLLFKYSTALGYVIEWPLIESKVEKALLALKGKEGTIEIKSKNGILLYTLPVKGIPNDLTQEHPSALKNCSTIAKKHIEEKILMKFCQAVYMKIIQRAKAYCACLSPTDGNISDDTEITGISKIRMINQEYNKEYAYKIPYKLLKEIANPPSPNDVNKISVGTQKAYDIALAISKKHLSSNL